MNILKSGVIGDNTSVMKFCHRMTNMSIITLVCINSWKFIIIIEVKRQKKMLQISSFLKIANDSVNTTYLEKYLKLLDRCKRRKIRWSANEKVEYANHFHLYLV